MAMDVAVAHVNFDTPWPADQPTGEQVESPDHFTTRNGIEFAGTHLIIDLWGASHLDDMCLMEDTMREAVKIAGATE